MIAERWHWTHSECIELDAEEFILYANIVRELNERDQKAVESARSAGRT